MATVDVKGLTAMQWTAAPLHTILEMSTSVWKVSPCWTDSWHLL